MNKGEVYQRVLSQLRDTYDIIAKQAATDGYEMIHAEKYESNLKQDCGRESCKQELMGHLIKLIQGILGNRIWVHKVCP